LGTEHAAGAQDIGKEQEMSLLGRVDNTGAT
jgi:hypothetical protein